MTAAALFASWTPRDGETVHLNARNPWAMPAGRYRVSLYSNGSVRLDCIQHPAFHVIREAEALAAAEGAAILTPISDAELERERHEVQLRAAAPLRQRRTGAWRAQHDASDLALFRAANETGLGL
jgi:hypothetical protein